MGASPSLYPAGISNPEFNLSRPSMSNSWLTGRRPRWPQFLPLLNERAGLHDF